MNKNSFSAAYVFAVTAIYAAIIIFISCHHELWRDEVRAFSIVISSNSLTDLFNNLHNEGHPGLWYILLYVGHNLTGNPEIIKIIHLIIAISSVFILLKFAPFSKMQLTLILLGYFVLYEYAIINRNYSLSMVLIFTYCSLYKDRLKNIIPVSIVLFLLANTNAHSIIITFVLLLFLILDYFAENNQNNKVSKSIFVASCLFVLIGIFISIIQVIPDDATTATNIYHLNTYGVVKNIVKAMLIPGESYPTLFGIHNLYFTTIFIWIFILTFFKKQRVFYFLVFSVFGLSLFFKLVYHVHGPRHEGFLFLMIIASYWIENYHTKETILKYNFLEMISNYLYKNRKYILTIFLSIQIIISFIAVKSDLSQQYSSAKELGKLLRQTNGLNDAIIICEPDYLIEALPFYAGNHVYFIREKRFGNKVNFTTKSGDYLSLIDLLKMAKTLKMEYNKAIVIVIGYELSGKGQFVMDAGFSRKFIYSKNQLKLFLENTKKIASFRNSITDENYDVYVLK